MDLFTAVIDGWTPWARVFQSIEDFETRSVSDLPLRTALYGRILRGLRCRTGCRAMLCRPIAPRLRRWYHLRLQPAGIHADRVEC